jgi:hypothetical protein
MGLLAGSVTVLVLQSHGLQMMQAVDSRAFPAHSVDESDVWRVKTCLKVLGEDLMGLEMCASLNYSG